MATRASALLLLGVALHSLIAWQAQAYGAFEVDTESCGLDEFFDTSGVQCSPCIPNASPNETSLEAGYSTRCECDPGRVLTFTDSAEEEPLDFGSCTLCPQGLVPSKSGSYCVQCDSTSGDGWSPAVISADGASCLCAVTSATSVITETAAAGAPLTSETGYIQRCVQCPAGTKPNQEAMQCDVCEYPKQWSSALGVCVCPEVLPAGTRCALTAEAWENIMGAGSVNYEVVYSQVPSGAGVSQEITVDQSAVMEKYLLDFAAGCYETGNRKACNALGNLCVLQLHDPSTAACRLYQEIADLRESEEYHDSDVRNAIWSLSMPFLYYEGDANTVLFSSDIQTRVTFSGYNGMSDEGVPLVTELPFKLARYSLEGSFLGWRNFTKQFQLCGGPQNELSRWATFGVGYRNKCELELDMLLDLGLDGLEPEFLDLYFEDGPDNLYPVPMIPENLDGNQPGSDIAFASLTRRLFTVDAISGVEAPGKLGSTPQVMRYLRKFSLEVVLRASTSQANSGRIYPPRARIAYASRNPALRFNKEIVNPSDFSVTYTMGEVKVNDFLDAWDYMIIAAMMTAAVVGLLRVFRYSKTQGSGDAQSGGEMWTLIEFMVIIIDVGSMALFFVLAGITIYWVCFFKLQASVFTMLPIDEGPIWYRFRVSVICCVVGRAVTVLWLVWKQTSVDIFLLDWTEPKDLVNDKNGEVEKAPISCWRSLFVANEWNELQTLRMTSLEVSMFSIIFFLGGLGLENGAEINPDETDNAANSGEISSQMLRFGISTSMFILIEVAQILFVKLVLYYRIANPLVDFVDLLWLSNISMVILERRAGYYLHGQFTGTYVDTDAESLNDVLLRPHNDKRGLVDSEDVQTFMIFINNSLRNAYDTFRSNIDNKYNRQREQDGNIDYALRGPKNAGSDSTLQKESRLIKERFQEELYNIQKEHHSCVQDPSFVNRWIQLPPDESTSKTIFWRDYSQAYTSVLFYGHEFSLFVLQVILFTSIDMGLRSAAYSGSITYAIMWSINLLRNMWGENNLSQKSLVDKKFLI